MLWPIPLQCNNCQAKEIEPKDVGMETLPKASPTYGNIIHRLLAKIDNPQKFFYGKTCHKLNHTFSAS